MLNILRFVIFLSIFSSILMGMHYFILTRLASIFEFKVTLRWILFSILLAISPMLIFSLFNNFWNRFLQSVYFILASYMGVVWILFFLLFIYFLINLAYPIPNKISQIAIPSIAFILIIYSLWNAQHLVIREIEIPTQNLPSDVRIAQISDLHLGPIYREGKLREVVEKVNSLKADFVVITGDLFDSADSLDEGVLTPLKDLKIPSYFVFGNHDSHRGRNNTLKLLETTPLQVLVDESIALSPNFEIVALDDRGHDASIDTSILSKLSPKEDKFRLLLSHRPIPFKELKEGDVDLQLAGHLHSGQIFPFGYIVKASHFPFMKGLYEEEGRYTYVSSGCGSWGPPMRLGSKSEITSITLKAK